MTGKNPFSQVDPLHSYWQDHDTRLASVERVLLEYTGVWQDYEPTWTADGGGASVGDGTLSGRYCRVGKMVSFHLDLDPGPTTGFGSGTWRFGLPVAASGNLPDFLLVGGAMATDAGAANWIGQTLVGAGGTTCIAAFPLAQGDNRMAEAKSDEPMNWTGSDRLRLSGTYEID